MNEETITQESLPATMQEAYDSLMESINDDHVEEFISEAWDSRAEISTEEIEEEPTFELSEEEQAILDQAVEEAHQEIPANSATLLVDEATSRFSSAIWYENIQKKTVILAGVGGIVM